MTLISLGMTVAAPLSEPRVMPAREGFDTTPSRLALVLGIVVIAGVASFFAVFW